MEASFFYLRVMQRELKMLCGGKFYLHVLLLFVTSALERRYTCRLAWLNRADHWACISITTLGRSEVVGPRDDQTAGCDGRANSRLGHFVSSIWHGCWRCWSQQAYLSAFIICMHSMTWSIIDMLVSHSKSIKKQTRKNGLLRRGNEHGNEQVTVKQPIEKIAAKSICLREGSFSPL